MTDRKQHGAPAGPDAPLDNTVHDPELERVRLWDPLLRLFHWALVFFVLCSWGLAEFGPSKMTLHFYSGYAVLGLLGFRLIWGLIGPPSARFSHFLAGPGAILAYLRHMFDRKPSYWPGHNPMGGWAVVALLSLVALQALTGLMVDPDDFINVGPFANSVSPQMQKWAEWWHELGEKLLVAMVLLHVGMILFYRFWKFEDLVRPMITGWKWVRRRGGQG